MNLVKLLLPLFFCVALSLFSFSPFSISPGFCPFFPSLGFTSIPPLFSVTNLYLFKFPSVFCSVSLFIFFPFKMFFLWILQSNSLQGEKPNLDIFFLHNYRAKKQNMKKKFYFVESKLKQIELGAHLVQSHSEMRSCWLQIRDVCPQAGLFYR